MAFGCPGGVGLMGRNLRPGPASLEGLRWLARVGPAPLDAWRCALGWSEVAARSHARRLETQGWLARYPMTRGDGSLFVATRTGIRVLGLSLRASGVPAPTWWAHHCGCAWAAAYLQLPERNFIAERELLDDPLWSGRISWSDGKGLHSSGHRSDLVGFLPNGPAAPVEVELAQKSIARLRAIITLYVRWRSEGRIGGVIYVCGDQDGAERIMRVTECVIGPEWRGLQVRLLDTFREEIVQLGEQHRVARSAEMTANVGRLDPPTDASAATPVRPALPRSWPQLARSSTYRSSVLHLAERRRLEVGQQGLDAPGDLVSYMADLFDRLPGGVRELPGM
jgi:hypothetical protein